MSEEKKVEQDERGALACPFCGSPDVSEGEVLTSNPNGGASTQSMCRSCGALGPDAHLREDEVDFGSVRATAAWNRRAASTSGNVAPAVDAQPVAIYQVQTGDCWLDMTKEQFDNHSKSRPTRIVYAAPPATTDDARDAARYRFLRAGFGDMGPEVDMHNAFVDGGEVMDRTIDAALTTAQSGDQS